MDIMTGAGLVAGTIVIATLMLLGGDFGIASVPRQGTTVRLEIPVAKLADLGGTGFQPAERA